MRVAKPIYRIFNYTKGFSIPEQQIYSQNVKLVPVSPSSNAISGSWDSVWNVRVRFDGPRSFFYPVFNSLSPICCITLTNSTATRLSHLPFYTGTVKKMQQSTLLGQKNSSSLSDVFASILYKFN